jgi:hypothetical protein
MNIIVNGVTYPAKFCWTLENDALIMFGIYDSRPLFEVAKDFENANVIEKHSETEGNAVYKDTGRVLRAIRPNANSTEIQITVERSRA